MTDDTPGFGEPIRVLPDKEDEHGRVIVIMPDDDGATFARISASLAAADMVVVAGPERPMSSDEHLEPYLRRARIIGVGGMDGNRPSIRDIFNALGDGDVEVVSHPVEPPVLTCKQVVAERHRNDATWRRPNKHDRKKLRRGR